MEHFSALNVARTYRLSEQFRARADHLTMQAHRLIAVTIIRQDSNDKNVMQSFPWNGYDRLDLGVEDIVLARAILEHPSLATTLMPYFSDAAPPVADRVRALFDLRDPAPADKSEIDYLIESTDRALDDCETVVNSLPRSAMVHGFQSRDIAGQAAMIDRAPALRHYTCLKDHVRAWVLNPLKIAVLDSKGNAHEEEIGPVDSIRISSKAVSNHEELLEARATIAATRGENNRVGLLTPHI